MSFEYSMTVKILTEHYFEFLSLKGGCTGSSKSTLVKMLHCGKSHVTVNVLPSESLLCFVQVFPSRWIHRMNKTVKVSLGLDHQKASDIELRCFEVFHKRKNRILKTIFLQMR